MKIKKVFELKTFSKLDVDNTSWYPQPSICKTRPLDSDRYKILDIFPNLRLPSDKEIMGHFKIGKMRLVSGLGNGKTNIDVMVDDVEEWYYVRVIRFCTIGQYNEYYKCDQWDGLIDFISKITNFYIKK